MNLFYLDSDLDTNAEYHVDQHVVKIITEAAQLLTSAVWVDSLLGYVPRVLNSEERQLISEAKSKEPAIEERTFTRFLPTHINHPCAVWVRTSRSNYEWTYSYCDALNAEYQYRYNKNVNHKSFDAAFNLPDLRSLPDKGDTVRPLCMPDKYKLDDPIESYRAYYMGDKAELAKWKNRDKPDWWRD